MTPSGTDRPRGSRDADHTRHAGDAGHTGHAGHAGHLALRATTRPLEEMPDLIAEAGEDGFLWREEAAGLAANGVAARLDLAGGLDRPGDLRSVVQSLAGIESAGEIGLPGCGPVALGALPFDRSAPGHLVIPRRIVGWRRDKAWMTTIDSLAPGSPAPPLPTRASGSLPDHFSLASSLPHSEWKALVGEALDWIKRGDLEKVVFARRVEITANRPFVITDVLSRLAALYPSCMVFSVEGFLGASPELLVRRTGPHVETHPLAGTVARSGDTHADEALVAALMASPKTRHEHQVVIESLRSLLGQVCDELHIPDAPSIMGLRNVSHLATHISGRLRMPGDPGEPLPSALELVALIHPTPAIGGAPRESATHFIDEFEGFDRGRYAGPVGWIDARGDGAFALGIRSAEVSGARARIFAGNGIVEGSDPDDELAETQLKLQALLAALVRP